MSMPDTSIDPKILNSAREEFLSKKYADASLREICKKAGVTTGALYKRFPGKEALFEAVLAPTLKAVETMSVQVEDYDYECLDKNQMQSVWDMSELTLEKFVRFFYEHHDGFRLLLCCAEGSAYSDFLNSFVNTHTKRTMKFVDAAVEKNITDSKIDEDELHMLLTAFWTTLLEPIVHDFPIEKAIQHCGVVAKFFNWQAVFGF